MFGNHDHQAPKLEVEFGLYLPDTFEQWLLLRSFLTFVWLSFCNYKWVIYNLLHTSVAHQVLGESMPSFLWVASFLKVIVLIFCYDLGFWAQSQALRAFFTGMFFHYFVKILKKIWIKHGRNLHKQLAHGYVTVDI